MRLAERLAVPFAGEGSGIGPLTWGQQTVWRGILARGGPIILMSVEPMPDGKTVEDVAAELGFLMSRHQSLRTRLRPGHDGELLQVVASSGETSLEIVETGDADPRDTAGQLANRYEFGDRDYASEWPMRLGVVCHRGVPAYRVMGVCHTSTDGFGTVVIEEDLAGRDPATGRPKGPVTAMQPLEQAAWQASPAGQRQSAAAERYWERALRQVPPHWFAEPQDKPSPRYWQGSYRSLAAQLASQVIAVRLKTDTTPVILAAFCVALARLSGLNPAVPRLMVSNRFRPRFADSVSPLAQTCPCVVDVAGVTFDEAVRRAVRASMASYKHAYFVPVRIREILGAVSAERGDDVDVNVVYNDRRLTESRVVTGPLASPREIRAAMPHTTLRWEEKSDDPMDACHIHVVESPDPLEVKAFFDTAYIAPDTLVAMLRALEEVIVAAASDPATLTGV